MSLQLRPYQARLVERVHACWAAGQRRVLGVLPTGGGKTETAIAIVQAEATPTSRVLIIVERKTLAVQWVERLRKHGMRHVGLLQGENSMRLSAPVLVATAQSLRTRGAPDDVALVVVDESHIWHRTHDDVLERMHNVRVLGLTATPLREGLGLRFDTVVVGATIHQLQDEGQLVRARYFSPKADTIADALASISMQAGDFAPGELARAMRGKAIVGDVVGSWRRLAEDRQTIAFCVDKQHAREVADEFTAAGVSAAVVLDDTDDAERARLIPDFEARRLRVLVSVGVLSIGFDSPAASCAIMARPTMSLSLYLQQGGRVLRPYPGKQDALVLDHAGNVLRHGRLEDFEPPTDLSKIDKHTDKKTRRDAPTGWTCRKCEAHNDLADDACVECGAPRFRHTKVIVFDGQLHTVGFEHEGESLPGPTLDDVRRFYLQCRWYGASRGMGNPDGWAFHTAARRFKLDADAARRAIAWDWRNLKTIAPDDDAARWLRADLQRARVAARYRTQRGGSSHA